MTPEELEQKEAEKQKFIDDLHEKAEKLSTENGGAKIVPLYYSDPVDGENGTPIIGFLKEPNRVTKMAIGDELLKSTMRGQNVALTACLMKDISDKRLTSLDRKYDAIIFSAGVVAADFVQLAISQLKKKSTTAE